ncbi:uncharacterized protein LOC103517678 isoform X1 [Diaphorina citri]|uniref:Uncharacterized protein LOC103517678 isoform X1 n=1 Tax=Diaphorina citri TaxID=121845 RepID=A0A1S3DFQ1_DIACI|nr:uncharacterized protein LOC103517678 isoform X1 [Diaphorina citri]KAI5698919.1 hypothetical protein M8J75_013882 [Diaphorina citri]KAI5724183.1 hypothetical protein M8J76_016636 [Diaphorina citri]KAI5728942.1 hypothetical protein M8J77_023529 [Diaphorina citri]
MWKFKGNNLFRVALVAIVVLAILMQEVEGRRKILRGRKTITRTYYKSLGLPSWFVMLLVHGGFLLVGGISYAILHNLLIVRNKVPPNPYFASEARRLEAQV